MEREKLLARLPLQPRGRQAAGAERRRTACGTGGTSGGTLANHHDASITVFHARPTTGMRRHRTAQFDAQFARIKEIAESIGAPEHPATHRHRRKRFRGDYQGERTRLRRDLRGRLAARWPRRAGRRRAARAGRRTRRRRSSSCAMRARRCRCSGFSSPITGAAFSRLGAAVAMQYTPYVSGSAHDAVRARARAACPSPRCWWLPSQATDGGEEFVDEIKRLGDELGVSVVTKIGSGRRAEDVIVNAASNGDFDLLIMGVLYRSSDQRLYFGPKVRQILRNVRCSVALVVPPQPKNYRS